MSRCIITIPSDDGNLNIVHTSHIGFEEWVPKIIPPSEYHFVKSDYNYDPIWVFPRKYLASVIGLAQAAFDDLKIIDNEVGIQPSNHETLQDQIVMEQLSLL